MKRLLIQPLRRALGPPVWRRCSALLKSRPGSLNQQGQFQPIIDLSVQARLTEMQRALNSLLRGMISLLEFRDQQSQVQLSTHAQILRRIDAVQQDIIGLTEQLEKIRQQGAGPTALEADTFRLFAREHGEDKLCRQANRLSA